MQRLERLGIGSRRDILLFVAGSLVAFGLTIVWAFVLFRLIANGDQRINKYLLALAILGVAAVLGAIPLLLGWERGAEEGRARGRFGLSQRAIGAFMIRFGIAAQIFALLISLIGLYFATDPTRSVPVAFASFTAALLGLFVAGFGGNVLAPARA